MLKQLIAGVYLDGEVFAEERGVAAFAQRLAAGADNPYLRKVLRRHALLGGPQVGARGVGLGAVINLAADRHKRHERGIGVQQRPQRLLY